MSVEEDDGVTVTPPERCAIGLSFGNSNSSIAHTSSEGKPLVIANEEGDRQIPSILSYIDGEEYHGTQAKAQLVRNSKNTVAYFRDLLGKDFSSIDPTPCHASAHAQKHDDTVAFSINDTSSETPSTLTVSEVTTRHIRRLVSSASDFLGRPVNAAVVTIPTNFTDAQKSMLDKAAKEAGVEVLQFVEEPLAAMLAYDARPEAKVEDKMVVIADLGGTRSDITVVASRGGMYTVLATSHDYEYSGSKLDQVLIDHFAKEFMKKHKQDPREEPRSLAKLKLEAEATKKALSLGANATISIESLANGIDFGSTINRTRYEILANKVFGGFIRLIESTVAKADLDVLDINEIILVGGTSHTPKIATNLASAFSSSTAVLSPSTSPVAINPSESIARGAAIQASLVQDFDLDDIQQSIHPMVTVALHLTNAIGVLVPASGSECETFRPILLPDTAVPTRRTITYDAPKKGGDVPVAICEGTRHIKVTKPEPRTKANASADNGGGSEEDEDGSSGEEEEDVREKIWEASSMLAEVVVKDVKKNAKIEVMVNVNGEMEVLITAREVGGKGGVRVTLDKPRPVENGSA